MTCPTCGSIERVHEASGSYVVPGLAWVRTKLLEIAWVYSDSHLRRCPTCKVHYRHDRSRDTDSGTSEETLTRTDDDTTIGLLLQALQLFPANPKAGVLASLEALLGPPVVDRGGIEAGDARALFQAERTADPALAPLLAPHAHRELGARALAACGAIDVLAQSGTPAATRGLGRSGRPEAEPHLRRLLKHSDWHVRQAAAWALGELGLGADALQEAMLPDEEWFQVRETAAEALARVQDSGALVSALSDEDWHNRWNTAKAIAQLGQASKEVIEALRTAAIDPRCAVPAPQVGAVKALLAVGVPAAEVRALLEQAIGSGSDNLDKNLRCCLKQL
jgi:HEAT repeat protein